VADGYVLEVAFADSPGTASPTWTDVTEYMVEVMCRHGKQRQIGNTDAGTMTVRLKNQDRRFDPTNTSSPYNPNVLPLRQIRLRVEKDAVVYPLFRGYVQSWPQEPQGRTMTWTKIECVDGFLPLSKADVGEGETWPAELAGARIGRILDAADWPASLRDIDVGKSLIGETTIQLGSGVTALAAILETADAELGSFFIDGQGRACFHDRHRRRQSAYLTAAATFQDGNSTGFIYHDIVLDTDDDNIWNDIQVTATEGNTARAQDVGVGSSQEKYWRRTLARNVPLARNTEAMDQAEWLLLQNKDPRGKLSQITLKPRRTEAGTFAAVVAREISDHVIVKRWPQKVGSEISQHCSVESIQYAAKPGADRVGDVTVTWSLSTPAPSSVDWWILGDSTYSVLGSTTKAIY
jgi:hypothetical protein